MNTAQISKLISLALWHHTDKTRIRANQGHSRGFGLVVPPAAGHPLVWHRGAVCCGDMPQTPNDDGYVRKIPC